MFAAGFGPGGRPVELENMLASLREGTWLTAERLRVYSLMFVAAYALGTLVWFGTAHGLLDWKNRPLGSDFAQVYASGTLVLEGRPEAPYDNAAEFARQRQIFGEKTDLFTWGYPPVFLPVAALLACLPYLAALFLWQGLTLAGALAAYRKILPSRAAILPALAFPAVYVNFGHGQTGFAIAGLFAGALLCLEKRPAIAGVLFGLAAFKPQLGLLVPVALVAGGHWRAFAAAAITVVALALATWAGFGGATWTAFADALPELRKHGLEYSNTGFHKMQSLFAAVRLVDGPVGLAYALHGTLVAGLVGAIAWLWRGDAARPLKYAALPVAAALATPYGFDYDLVLIGPAIAFMAAHGLARGFLPWEKSLLALAWLMPIVARGIAEALYVPFGWLVAMALFALILRRVASETAIARVAAPVRSISS